MVELTKAVMVADFVFRATLQRQRAVFPAAQWFFHPTQGGGAFPPDDLETIDPYDAAPFPCTVFPTPLLADRLR